MKYFYYKPIDNLFYNFTNKQTTKSLEEQIFHRFCLVSFIFYIICLIVNLFLGIDYRVQFTILLGLLSSIYCFNQSYSKNKFQKAFNFYFFIHLIIIDINWFLSGGVSSSIILFIPLFASLIFYLLPVKSYKKFLTIIVSNLFLMFILEMLVPSLIVEYPSNDVKKYDLFLSALISIMFSSFMSNYFKNKYDTEKDLVSLKNLKLIESEASLRIEKERSEQADKEKGDFLAVMSHEIRTPLNAIVSISNLLSDPANNSQNETKEMVETLKMSSDSLLLLINDILDYSKIESENLRLENIPFNLRKMVLSLQRIYIIKANERNNSLNINIDKNIPEILIGDSLRVNQVISNLVSNSIKFTENGTISVDIEIKSIENDYATILFSVSDTGIGISKENHANVFKKFTQADSSTTRKYGGTGLGLSIIHGILKAMDSSINLESEINQGSKFYFELSFKINKSEFLEEDKSQKIISLNIHILLVEDNDINIMVASKFLSKWNMTYEVAKNGLIGLNKFKDKKYDLVLMDLQMPEMDGMTAVSKIRDFDKTTPIIALTAFANTAEKERAISLGFNDYITKPFKPDVLHEKILSLVSS